MRNGKPGGLPIALDRELGLPVRQQIRAALVRRIAEGALPAGASLPSVRELAAVTGVAPMTVTRVYAELKEAGLVEARSGSGTFVADSPLSRPQMRGAVAALGAEVDAMVGRALDAGLGAGDLLALLTARAVHRLGQPRPPHPAPDLVPDLVVVGLFPAATESYAARVAEQVGCAAAVRALVLPPEAGADGPEAAVLRTARLVVTFGALRARIEALAPGARVAAIRFIPASSTRLALAAIDPMARVAVVSRFADFLPVLELGVRRFAPHVACVTATDVDAALLPAAVAGCDVIVTSTGAEAALALAPPGAVRIEYRHVPDPGEVERLVMPRLRSPAPEAPAPEMPAAVPRKEAS